MQKITITVGKKNDGTAHTSPHRTHTCCKLDMEGVVLEKDDYEEVRAVMRNLNRILNKYGDRRLQEISRSL